MEKLTSCRFAKVPAADAKRSQDAMDETFLLTNIAPQVGEGFNRDCACPLAVELARASLTSLRVVCSACRLGLL